MNKTSIKNYAIWARNELISRVSQKAFEYGVEKDNIVSSNANDINGRLLSGDEKKKRQKLIKEVNQKGFDQVMEEVAYTWFNRFIALRFMEVNNYLPKKVRVFTNNNNEFKPQIMDEALHVELLGLDKNKVITLKEENNDEELYKELLLATCNDMSQYLPGMFKPIDDYMTLLFPSNLLREESVLGRLISDIDEKSWNDQVQIIGWLYQYYNTEPKDKVYARKKGTKIKKEEIPAVTQLFTPDWIVRYMTENSLGRFWFDGHPDTDIKSNWKYYLDEAEQEESVQIELNKIKEEHAKYKPEDIKFLDPCMGSGHILVYAFDVLMQIYVSEGWSQRDAAKSILKNNIYGLDIDERAYQLSYFALMMKARQYNRRILNSGIVPNIMDIQESNHIDKNSLRLFDNLQSLATEVVDAFIDAKEYGSILNISFSREQIESLKEKLKEIKNKDYPDLLTQAESVELVSGFTPLLKQAEIMSQKYECVVTNPPYNPVSNCSVKVQEYAKKYYPDSKTDFFAIFMEKASSLLKKNAYYGMINMHSWMSLSSYETLRRKTLSCLTIINMAHLGARAFEEIGGEVVQTTAFVLCKLQIMGYLGLYRRLVDGKSQQDKERLFLEANKQYFTNQQEYLTIDGCPISYWLSDAMKHVFSVGEPATNYIDTFLGIITGDNEKFLRLWFEPSIENVPLHAKEMDDLDLKTEYWIPYNKGGLFRRWYGIQDYVIDWRKGPSDKKRGKKDYEQYYLQNYVAWSYTVSSSAKTIATRYYPNGFLWDVRGSGIFDSSEKSLYYLAALISSKVGYSLFRVNSEVLSCQVENIIGLPIIMDYTHKLHIDKIVKLNISLSRSDWNSFEPSWDFQYHPMLPVYADSADYAYSLEYFYEGWKRKCNDRFYELKSNEEELNKIFIDIYGLQDELTPEIEDKDVTVHYVVDSKDDVPESMKASKYIRTKEDEVKSLISFAIGCMFGRYNLWHAGLAYAGGDWDSSIYDRFPADGDNIIPICDDEYFDDDIVGRFIEFMKVAYGADTLDENLRFIADALGGKGTPQEVLRNYFINDFFKDHCNTYQVTGSGKRPIYWQFDSGKKNGFKALIYIHRYTPDLIARMRTSYIHEQQSRYDNEIVMIQNQINSATTTSERTKKSKQLKKLKEQAEELRVYEEKIHHWADKMEPMDLDDGVKANYAKFQELLAKIK